MHIKPSLVFEILLIWNVKGLFHGHLVWFMKWQLFGIVIKINFNNLSDVFILYT